MSEQEKPAIETIHLPSGGSVPGIPGSHGPGSYIVNWTERTIERVEDALHLHEPDPVANPSQSKTPLPALSESAPPVAVTPDPTELPSTLK